MENIIRSLQTIGNMIWDEIKPYDSNTTCDDHKICYSIIYYTLILSGAFVRLAIEINVESINFIVLLLLILSILPIAVIGIASYPFLVAPIIGMIITNSFISIM